MSLPALNLKQGDRLEPPIELLDVGKFEKLQLPVTVIFWRSANQSITLHRNPIFSRSLGCTLETLALDVLHILHLGVFKLYCMWVIWTSILANAYSVDAVGRESLVELSLRKLKIELDEWYKRQRRRFPDQPVYQIQELTPSMIGTASKKSLATTGAEAGTLIFFCRDEIARLLDKVGARGPALLQFGNAITRMLQVMRESPRSMTHEQRGVLVKCAVAAFHLRKSAGLPFIPKFHLMLHMVVRTRVSGNPYYHHTFIDEHYNGEIKKLAATCYRRTWYTRLLSFSRAKLCRERRAKRRRE